VLALGMGLGFLGAVMAAAGGAACAEANAKPPPSYLSATKSGPVPEAQAAPASAEKARRPAYFYATKSGHIPAPLPADPPQQAAQVQQARRVTPAR
jgi:hypothetical protein